MNLAKRIIPSENCQPGVDLKPRSGSLFDLKKSRTQQDKETLKGTMEMVHCDLPVAETSATTKPQVNGFHSDTNHPATHNHQHQHQHDIKEIALNQRSFSNLSSMHTIKTFESHYRGGKTVPYQNTYEVEPTHSFDTKTVRNIVRAELEYLQVLTKKQNTGVPTNTNCLKTADIIKTKLKSQGYRRYRYIVNITVTDNREQTFRVASRFFWDAERDKYVSQSIKDKHFFLVCVVYAVYFE